MALVERMLELHRNKHCGKLAPSQIERMEREIAATDAEIDALVYDLPAVGRALLDYGPGTEDY